MTELRCKDEVYAIVGAAMAVYNELKSGYLEAVYQEALEIELALRGIPFRPQVELPVVYKAVRLQKRYVVDLLAFDAVMIEVKAIEKLTGREDAQLINYLYARPGGVGVLLNFGHYGGLEWKRMVKDKR